MNTKETFSAGKFYTSQKEELEKLLKDFESITNVIIIVFPEPVGACTEITWGTFKLLYASKENPKVNEFNYFKFMYEGLTYELLDDKLKLINE